MSTEVTTFRASIENCEDILSVTNDAYMADAFFKKPEYHLRFNRDNVKSMLAAPNGRFILAKMDNEICGGVYLEIKTEIMDNILKVSGGFSAVAVPSKYGKRGIGATLIKAVESTTIAYATEQMLNNTIDGLTLEVFTEMGVINVRPDLFSWYSKQGYEKLHELRPNNAELTRIILDGMDVCCILMRKQLI